MFYCLLGSWSQFIVVWPLRICSGVYYNVFVRELTLMYVATAISALIGMLFLCSIHQADCLHVFLIGLLLGDRLHAKVDPNAMGLTLMVIAVCSWLGAHALLSMQALVFISGVALVRVLCVLVLLSDSFLWSAVGRRCQLRVRHQRVRGWLCRLRRRRAAGCAHRQGRAQSRRPPSTRFEHANMAISSARSESAFSWA